MVAKSTAASKKFVYMRVSARALSKISGIRAIFTKENRVFSTGVEFLSSTLALCASVLKKVFQRSPAGQVNRAIQPHSH